LGLFFAFDEVDDVAEVGVDVDEVGGLERESNDGPALGPGTFGSLTLESMMVWGDGLESRR
jgi:hypothetical protein